MNRLHRRHVGALSFVALPLLSIAWSAPASGLTDSVSQQPAQPRPQASPRDSLAVKIGGSDITVNYSRPSKRGRVLFNGLPDMKWGMVWRTGANTATHFSTSKALAFGPHIVPAGTYTLYTKLMENGKWDLIVNKQTTQWGTVYDEKQDLVRIPLTVTSTNPVVETLEITVKPAGKGGEIAIAWDVYRASAPFVVK